MYNLINWIIFLLNIIPIDSEYLINNCFSILGHFQKQINIPVKSGLNFFPDVVKLTTLLKENTFDSEIRVLRRESFILQKADHVCTDSFIYHVPASSHPILSLEIVFSWGSEDFLLDCHAVIMKKDFEENIYILQGTKENILVLVYLKHEEVPHLSTPQSQAYPLPDFNKKVRPLLQGESYCLSFFNREIQGFLIFPKSFLKVGQISEYYILSLHTYTNKRIDVSLKRFLVKVFPCESSVGFDQIFRIFVEPTTNIIEFELSDEAVIAYYIKNLKVSSGTAVDAHGRIGFDFNNLEVKIQPLTQEMADQKVGILLYSSMPYLKYCEAHIPEKINLNFSFVFEQKSNDVVLSRMIRSIDVSTEKFGVYNVRPGTLEEYENCIA